MDFQLSILIESLPLLLRGAWVTIVLTVVSSVIGIALGFAGALCRVSRRSGLRIGVAAYVLTFRAIPLLVTLTVFYYGLPSAGINLSAFAVAILGLSVTLGAYATEIIRAGIESIPAGQMRAARALGMSHVEAMRIVILPQATRRVLAPITNEVLSNLKNTSLVSTIAIADLLRVGVEVMTWRANTFSPFFGVALGYFVLTLPLIGLIKVLETRIRIT